MSNCQDALTELLWNSVMDSGQDEDVGSTQEKGWYGLFRGSLYGEQIDHHNEIVLDDDLQREQGYRELPMLADEIFDAMSAAGFIVKQHTDGAIYSTIYKTGADLELAWGQILASYSLNVCDECEAEAEEYGVGSPIIHESGCPTVAKEQAA